MSTTKAKVKKGAVKSGTGKAGATSPRAARKKKAKEVAVQGDEEERCEGILCPAAMDNLYYIAHDAADALRLRGFGWRKSKGKKKGRKAK